MNREQRAQLKFFNDPTMHCVDVLLNFGEKPHEEKIKCLHTLQTNLEEFSKTLLYGQFVPLLLDVYYKMSRRIPNESESSKHTVLFRKLILVLATIVNNASPREYADNLDTCITDFFRRCSTIKVTMTELQ
ncbi:hypothetical protein PHET_00208 [Paragonimus heterotremus]|uniref:Uncharacterized protein n=1 Tax=Paragonimus heterotremus TaxID=100268 RepID=A0A8J4TFC4_9TREM|nr:hypothetical protein PHET_00208 [Paragonimus heterotremus]